MFCFSIYWSIFCFQWEMMNNNSWIILISFVSPFTRNMDLYVLLTILSHRSPASSSFWCDRNVRHLVTVDQIVRSASNINIDFLSSCPLWKLISCIRLRIDGIVQEYLDSYGPYTAPRQDSLIFPRTPFLLLNMNLSNFASSHQPSSSDFSCCNFRVENLITQFLIHFKWPDAESRSRQPVI